MSASQLAENGSRQHPLQRLDSPSKGFSGAFHAVGLASFYTCYKFLVDNPNAINSSFGWHFQYLTIIGLSISTLSFACALIADITNTRTPFLLKNYLALLAAPIEIVISLLYWTLRTIDISLVVPPDLPQLPLLIDFAFHLFPPLLLTIDALLLSPPWPTPPPNPNAPLTMLTASTGVAFVYWFWIELCYSRNGFYPYPLFGLLTTTQRAGLFVLSAVIMWVVGAGLRVLYAYVNGYEKIGEAVEKDTKKMK